MDARYYILIAVAFILFIVTNVLSRADRKFEQKRREQKNESK